MLRPSTQPVIYWRYHFSKTDEFDETTVLISNDGHVLIRHEQTYEHHFMTNPDTIDFRSFFTAPNRAAYLFDRLCTQKKQAHDLDKDAIIANIKALIPTTPYGHLEMSLLQTCLLDHDDQPFHEAFATWLEYTNIDHAYLVETPKYTPYECYMRDTLLPQLCACIQADIDSQRT